jgi:cytochrome c
MPMRRHTLPDRLRDRAAVGGLCALLLTGCDRGPDPAPSRPLVYGGDPDAGASLIRGYGCGGCHTIPGITGADGTVGPPLTEFAYRSYIAGNLPNTPGNLVAWIVDPQAVEPGTAMPDLGVTEEQARHIAAYLYSLR